MTEHLQSERFEIHPSRRVVLVDGHDVDLGSRAFDLLWVLVENRDRVVSKRDLIRQTWPGQVVEENTLQAQISLLRKRLGAASIATVAGRGYRLVVPLTVVSASAGAGQPNSTRSIALPVLGGRFIGRTSELAECVALLESSSLLTLTGIGGSGKTRLAVELARALDAQSSACFVDLSALSQPGQVWLTIAQALGLREGPDTSIDAVRRHLRHWNGTLVLDSCEHIAREVAIVAAALANSEGRLRILATSRHPLGVHGEQIYLVSPLSMPAADGLRAAGRPRPSSYSSRARGSSIQALSWTTVTLNR